MIDLHCHLLPGIDDGPATLAQSITLCKIAVDDGITHAICTPHIHPGRWGNTRLTIAAQCKALQQALNQQAIPLQLGFAGEVRLTDQLMGQIENNDIPFYGEVDGYKIMLLELPHGHIIPGSDKLVQWLLKRNIRPLIAHPERNKQVMKDVEQLLPFIELGCWLQITGGAVTGAFGDRAMAVAHQLLENDTVTLIASDGHNSGARQPTLKHAHEYIALHYGADRARRLTQQTPLKLVASQFVNQEQTV